MKDTNALIYVVEDDEGIGEVYEGAFEDEYLVKIFASGKEFFEVFEKVKPSIIILDIMLPDMDSYTILTKIREIDERVPVIIVSAKSDEISFVKGLNKGADDYMAKPFSVLELMARVKTNLRRANLYVTNAGDFTVDHNTYKILYKGEDLKLTLKEFKLFKILIGQAGITVNREALFREVGARTIWVKHEHLICIWQPCAKKSRTQAAAVIASLLSEGLDIGLRIYEKEYFFEELFHHAAVGSDHIFGRYWCYIFWKQKHCIRTSYYGNRSCVGSA